MCRRTVTPTPQTKTVDIVKWCAYYGDVSAIRFPLIRGESLESLGENLGLNEAVFQVSGN